MAELKEMRLCPSPGCGYTYNPDRGDPSRKLPARTQFEALPEDWTCPVCGAKKEDFVPLHQRFMF